VKNFLIRTASGFIYALLTLGSIAAGPVYFGTLLFLFLIISLAELRKISEAEGFKINSLLFLLPAFLVYLLIFYASFLHKAYLFLGLLGLVHLYLIAQLFTKEKSLLYGKTAFTILPLIYVALPLALLNYFFYLPGGMIGESKQVIVGYFIIIWLNDTFAYMTGKLFGRHKMFESVSPKKTWEGSLGGLLFGLGGAYLMSLFSVDLSSIEWLGLAFITIILGTFGDLFESLLKRRAGIKDSGNILPGHGGLLDRLDSILISAPFVFFYLYILM